MNILVTGANGFVGRRLLKKLSDSNYQVTGTFRTKKPDLGNLVLLKCDLKDKESLEDAIKHFKVIYHCAGKVGDFGGWNDFYENNYIATKNLLDISIKNKVEKIIYISSQTVYGLYPFGKKIFKESDKSNTISEKWANYTKSKQITENLFFNDYHNKINYCILRPGIIYGPEDNNFTPRYIEFCKKNVIIGDGRNNLNLIYIDNLIEYLIRLAEGDKTSNNVYNVCDFPNITQEDLHNRITAKMNIFKKPKKIPCNLAFYTAGLYEKYYFMKKREDPPLISRYGIYLISNKNVLDVERIRNAFQINYVEPSRAIENTISWFLN